MKKIKIIIPYFGRLPKFFPYFLLTAKRNKRIDFLIYTDQKVEQFSKVNAQNISFVNISFDTLKKKIQSKFDFKISLDTPYKLCDYKVAYGFIFKEELENYDYWGFCDTDVLLGDIYHFLEENDFFTKNYARYGLLGHLQIYKNTEEVNTIFMTGIDLGYRLNYRNVFTSEQTFIFDEARGIQKLFEKTCLKQLQKNYFDDLDIANFSFRNYGEGKTQRYYYWSEKEGLESIELKDNQVKVKHPLYVHFQKRLIDCPEFINSKEFYVVPNRLVLGERLSIEEIQKLTQNKFYWEHIEKTFLKKFKREKWTINFIRHKLRMRR
ncbi:hypothetical protein ATE35_01730 [Streptococcus oralis subsp. tigurinus]|uniref:Uncharacterized protein n=1 Tax=Streptococcus oralis subsp. tigurinus TaxID=1077464 RepID=A0A1X0WX22_STROR|nr:DUF6625 family protein [Streptococcus oralis]ORJ31312.1 hypothetical protein ATE35_01730 [Streptococcus oralis subsp. tigurinus]